MDTKSKDKKIKDKAFEYLVKESQNEELKEFFEKEMNSIDKKKIKKLN